MTIRLALVVGLAPLWFPPAVAIAQESAPAAAPAPEAAAPAPAPEAAAPELGPAAAEAQETDLELSPPVPAQAEPAVAPRALDELRQVADAYKKLPFYKDDGLLTLGMKINGQKRFESSNLRLSYLRPANVKLCTGQMRLMSNGERLVAAVDFTHRYAQGDPLKRVTPGAILETPIGAAFLGGTPGVPLLLILSLLTEDDPVAAILQDATGLRYLEQDGQPVLVVHPKRGPAAALFLDRKTHLVNRIRLRLRPTEYFGRIPPGLTITEMELTWAPRQINPSGPPAPSDFAFIPPRDFNQVSSFSEVFTAERGRGGLIGQTAPEFELETLDGARAGHSDLKGKVGVLLFWATWSPASASQLRAMLPIVGRYKDRGLVFVAVNIDDDPPRKSESDPARLSQARKEQAGQIREKLRRWLRENRVEAGGPSALTIALDPDNSVGMAYQLQYIPTTILIDRQGKIHNQLIGRVSDFESNLSRQIEALLSGPPR